MRLAGIIYYGQHHFQLQHKLFYQMDRFGFMMELRREGILSTVDQSILIFQVCHSVEENRQLQQVIFVSRVKS
jgi:hypothetical protein